MEPISLSIWASSLKTNYETLSTELESLSQDLSAKGAGPHAAFLNSLNLRLKIWGANIHIEEGILDSVEPIDSMAAQIRLRLNEVLTQCNELRACPDDAPLDLAMFKNRANQSMDALTALSEPIKTLTTQSPKESVTASEINSRFSQSWLRSQLTSSGWLLLREPGLGFPLLGSIVTDPIRPDADYFPFGSVIDLSDKITHTEVTGLTHSRSASNALSMSVALGPLSGMGKQAGMSSFSDQIQAPTVHTRTLTDAEDVFAHLVENLKAEITDSIRRQTRRKAFFIVGIKSTSSLTWLTESGPQLRSADAQADLGTVTAATTGVPVEAEVSLGGSRRAEKSSTARQTRAGEVIFAVKCRAIEISVFTKKTTLARPDEFKASMSISEDLTSSGTSSGMWTLSKLNQKR